MEDAIFARARVRVPLDAGTFSSTFGHPPSDDELLVGDVERAVDLAAGAELNQLSDDAGHCASSFRCEPLRSCARRSGMARASPSRSRHVFRDEKGGDDSWDLETRLWANSLIKVIQNRPGTGKRIDRQHCDIRQALLPRSPVWCV